MDIQNEYDKIIQNIETRNNYYNSEFKRSFNPEFMFNNFNIINYRQSLIDNICHNNDLIDWYKDKLEKHIKISNFFQRIYFFLNFVDLNQYYNFYEIKRIKQTYKNIFNKQQTVRNGSRYSFKLNQHFKF